jgi:hypothetical protein
MPTKRNAVQPEIYQLTVTLLGTSPPIWRQLLVPADLTPAQLHDVLQIAMGWEQGHMHEFSVRQRRFWRPDPEDRLMGRLLRRTNVQYVSLTFGWTGEVNIRADSIRRIRIHWKPVLQHDACYQRSPKSDVYIALEATSSILTRGKQIQHGKSDLPDRLSEQYTMPDKGSHIKLNRSELCELQ